MDFLEYPDIFAEVKGAMVRTLLLEARLIAYTIDLLLLDKTLDS